MNSRRIHTVLTGVAAVAVLAGCATSAEPAVPEPTPDVAGVRVAVDYVALGDSAAAGPRIPVQTGVPGCQQSDSNYPHVLAREIGAATFTDVTCSGARSGDVVSQSQSTSSGPVPPQVDALSADTDLVTLTIGGNDVDLVRTAGGCVNFAERAPLCRDRLTVDGVDTIAQTIDDTAAEWGGVIDAIAARAPEAKIVVVGYGTYLRPGGCFPAQPILPDDADYLQGNIGRLNDALAAQASERGATFVDTRPISVGHDVCAVPADRYFEGLIPVNPAAPLHPTAAGMAAIGGLVADTVGRNGR